MKSVKKVWLFFRKVLPLHSETKHCETNLEMETTVLQKDQLYQNFVQAFRAHKKRKREWQDRMSVVLAQEEEDIRRQREVLYADYE